jgi:hypothetical protein
MKSENNVSYTQSISGPYTIEKWICSFCKQSLHLIWFSVSLRSITTVTKQEWMVSIQNNIWRICGTDDLKLQSCLECDA